MKSYAEAVTIISNAVESLDSRSIPLEQAVNCVLAENIYSPIDVTPFRNSAMDGFAVCFKDIKNTPCTLPIKAIAYAGENEKISFESHTALKIMTGAPVPDGYDTVVRFEDTTYNDKEVTINVEVQKSQNVRMPGEDIKKNALVFSAGQLIKSIYPGILASIGMDKVSVVRKPNVLILSTGNELVEPGRSLSYGQLYNSNSFTVRSMLEQFCGSITVDSILLDNPAQVTEALSQDYDVIITSGGVSAGDKDYIPQIANECGWQTFLHKAAIKPGKPIFFAKRGKQYLFGLPGNPLSTTVTCAIFVIPALKKMIGIGDYQVKTESASLRKDSIRKSGRTLIWPGKISLKQGVLTASFAEKKTSSALSALINTDGLIFQYLSGTEPPRIEFALWHQILNP